MWGKSESETGTVEIRTKHVSSCLSHFLPPRLKLWGSCPREGTWRIVVEGATCSGGTGANVLGQPRVWLHPEQDACCVHGMSGEAFIVIMTLGVFRVFSPVLATSIHRSIAGGMILDMIPGSVVLALVPSLSDYRANHSNMADESHTHVTGVRRQPANYRAQSPAAGFPCLCFRYPRPSCDCFCLAILGRPRPDASHQSSDGRRRLFPCLRAKSNLHLATKTALRPSANPGAASLLTPPHSALANAPPFGSATTNAHPPNIAIPAIRLPPSVSVVTQSRLLGASTSQGLLPRLQLDRRVAAAAAVAVSISVARLSGGVAAWTARPLWPLVGRLL